MKPRATVKPILFSAPMIQALIAGRKTQTRRILKPQPPTWQAQVIDITQPYFDEEHNGWGQTETEWSPPCWDMPMGEPEREIWRPLKGLRFAIGDLLWVRETWTARMDDGWTIANARSRLYREEILYRADDVESIDGWWPSIHMPREFSRLTLAVTAVKIERLQDISDEDAEAEGCPPCRQCDDVGWINSGPDGGWQCTEPGCGDAYIDQFRALWNSINGPDAWDKNPWVACLSFEVHRTNVDTVIARTPK